MAIDTREKRASASAVLPFLYHAPVADSAVGAADRAQITWSYSGLTYTAAITVTGTRLKYEIELYDKYGDLKAVMTKKAVPMWEYLRIGGCGQADIVASYAIGGEFDSMLRPGDEVRIKIRSELRYSGKLLKVERRIDNGQEGLALTFYGYMTELAEAVVNATYENMEVSAIVKDILDNYIVGSKRVTYDAEDVQETDYAVTSITFKHSVLDAIALLADLAGNVEWGVDSDKKFFFKHRDTNVRRAFIIGREVYSYREIEDHESVKNRVHFFATGDQELVDLTSQMSTSIYGEKEINLYESSVTEQSDANRLMAVTLKNLASRNRQIVIKTKSQDSFIERDGAPIGAAAVSREPFSIVKKYGQNIKYGQFETATHRHGRYGNIKRDQIGAIRYSLAGGGMDLEITLEKDVSNLGSQQRRIEFEIKDLQRR